MILEHVELHQICQHEHLSVDLKPGLIGILGPNGAGKSNFVNMSFATLTGDPINPGVKTDNVRWGKPPDDYSATTATWQHKSERFTVRRALEGTHNYLRREGKKELRGAKEITAEIENILGIPRKALDFMFVPQWEMFAFISADPATRSATFSHLCGTAQVEKLHKQLGEEIKVYRAAADGVRDNRTEIEQRLLERTARITELTRQLQEAQKQTLALEDLEDYKATVAAVQRQRDIAALIKSVQKEHTQTLADLDAAKRELATAEKLMLACEGKVMLLGEEAAEAEAELRNRKEQAELASRRETLRNILSEKKMPVPPAPDWYDDADNLKEEAATLRKTISEAEQLIELINSGKVAKCPTCHTPVDNLQSTAETYKRCLPQLQKRLVGLNEKVGSCRNYDSAMVVYTKGETKQQARRAAAKAELDTMPKPLQTSGRSDDHLQTAISYYNETQQQLQGYMRRHKAAELAVATLRGRVSATDDDLTELTDQIDPEFVDLDLTDYHELIEAHEKAQPTIAILTARKADLEELNQADRDELAKVTKALADTAVVRQYVSDLESSREVAHRDNFPKLAAQKWLDDLTGLVNETLEDFDSPFRVETTDDLSFVAIKPDGRRERAERLSGGQKMLLALAFRFSVNRIMAADIGLMILDEPTAGVDKTNVENMTDILKKLSSYTKDQGRQIMIITHDENLTRAFDQVIYIDKQN